MTNAGFLTVLRKNAIFVLILAGLSIGIYFNSLGNSFAVVDDLHGYIENTKIRDITASFKTLHIQNMVYSINYRLFGINPLPLRILTLLDHAVASILLFLIMYEIFGKKVAYIAALLFAVHPVNTESVNWVSAQFYILMTNFQFAAILSHLAYRRTNNKNYIYLTAAIFLLYLILFQHPWVLTVPMAIIVIDFLILKKGWNAEFHKKFWLAFLPIIIIYLFFLFPQAYRHRMVGESAQPGKVLLNEQALIPILEGYPYSVYNTFRLYIFPKNLTIYYDGNTLTSIDRLMMFLTFLLYCGGTLYAYITHKKVAGLLLLIIVCIAPVFSPIKVTWYITERYLYFGTGFFTALLAILFMSIEKKSALKHLAYILTGVLLIVFSIRTVMRNAEWKNPETLALATMKTSPKSVRPYNDVAGHYVMTGRIDDAKKYYQKALSMYPSIVAMNNLGYIYIRYDLDPRVRTLKQPYDTIINLGIESMQKKEFRLALYYFNEVYTQETSDIRLLNNIAASLLELGAYDKAQKYLDIAITINVTNPDTYFFYGYLSFKKGDFEQAKQYLQKVLKIDPNHVGAQTNLQVVMQRSGTITPTPSLPIPGQK